MWINIFTLEVPSEQYFPWEILLLMVEMTKPGLHSKQSPPNDVWSLDEIRRGTSLMCSIAWAISVSLSRRGKDPYLRRTLPRAQWNDLYLLGRIKIQSICKELKDNVAFRENWILYGEQVSMFWIHFKTGGMSLTAISHHPISHQILRKLEKSHSSEWTHR